MKSKKLLFTFFVFCLLFGIYKISITLKTYERTINVQQKDFKIEAGTSIKSIAGQLENQNIIASSYYFIYYGIIHGAANKIKPGDYTIPPQISLKELFSKFQTPEKDYVKIVIPEGFSYYQIASRLDKAGLGKKETYLKLTTSFLHSSLVTTKPGEIYHLEGYLFPATYQFPKNASAETIVKKMHSQLDSIFTDKEKTQAKKLGYSIHDILTIASLIEKEAVNDAERQSIAGVIYNRLDKGMPLQIDASVIYAINHGEKSIERLYYKDLKINSPYNTYKRKGLPPGPIASPGKPSIYAALYPEKHNYYYYVLGNKQHIFSSTYKEHQQNVNKYIK